MKEEIFVGKNQMLIDDYSPTKVDAGRVLVFQQLPPVLTFRISKFETGFDFEKNKSTTVKLDPR